MDHGDIASATHNHFMMENFDKNPSVLLVEMSYLVEMFNLEIANEKGKPVVITLREKPEHFEAR